MTSVKWNPLAAYRSAKTYIKPFGNIFRALLLVLVFMCHYSCRAQTKIKKEQLDGTWSIELRLNDIGAVRTVLYFDTDRATFEAHTRKNADKDILGGWTSLLGRTFSGSFKDGSLLRISDGIFETGNDTLRFAGILVSALGKYNIDGYVVGEEMFARIRNKRQGSKGSLYGVHKSVKLPIENYAALFGQSVTLTEKNIYNKAVLQTKEWKAFVKDMSSVAPHIQDDLEMVFAFYYYAGKLPFSHYALLKPIESKDTQAAVNKKRVFLEEKSPATAYLKITSFDGSAAEMNQICSLIRQKNYANLIVDLRNNPGGSVEAGMAFATNMVDRSFYGGVFLTQRYFNNNRSLPSIDGYKNFPAFTESNYDLIIEGIHKTDGLCLKIIPQEKTYNGKLFLLTNGRTASTCEPIVYGLKQQKRATVVGTTTAGAMLNGEMFPLANGFNMVIPTADYYTSDGFRIDQNGVAPNIEVKEDAALEYVMEQLIGAGK